MIGEHAKILPKNPKKNTPKKGQFGYYTEPNYEKELARVSSNTKARTPQQKTAREGAKSFYKKKKTKEISGGKSRKKRRTRQKRRKSRRRK